jgi:hypothetical protein
LARFGISLLILRPDTIPAEPGFPHQAPLNEAQKFAATEQWLQGQHSVIEVFEETDCQMLHSKDLTVHPTLPTRVIDVGSLSGERVHLVETASLPSKNAPYIALSYRWGDSNSLTTRKETLPGHLERIVFNDLPKSIQDALIITRRLKVRYLWVDALCIIQDDNSDWLREAEKMGDIYINSYCTIAAHSAQHANHGFLEQAMANPPTVQLGRGYETLGEEAQKVGLLEGEHLPQLQVPTELHAAISEKGNPEKSAIFHVSGGSNVRVHIENSEISRRGWVLQERLLSQRTIHFADDGTIYLESGSEMKNIEGIYEKGYRSWGTGLRSMVQQLVHTDRESSDSELLKQETQTEVYRDWYTIVEHYSSCFLTDPDDKLPARTGIICQMQTFTDDKCFMGVWGRRVQHCLLWLRGKEALKPQGGAYQIKYRAASWSWAAYDGQVQFPVWNSKANDALIRPEFGDAIFFHRSLPDEGKAAESLKEPMWLVIKGAKMLRNISLPVNHPDVGTVLRFLEGQIGKPAWIQACNWDMLRSETRFWTVHDDSGERIGWASLDSEERDEIDGEENFITCSAIASHADDRPNRGFVRGFLVLFIQYYPPGVWKRVGMGQITQTSLFEKTLDNLIIM